MVRFIEWAAVLAVGAVLGGCVDPDTGVGQGSSTGWTGTASSGGGDGLEGSLDGVGVDETGVDPPAERSFFIAESMDFTNNGCIGTDVNDVTSTFRDALIDDGWVGTHAVEGQTAPSHFIDPMKKPFGLDAWAGDSTPLAVYAGHGWMDFIHWGTADDSPGVPRNKRCKVKFSDDVRLGAMAGGWAKAVVLMTSCTGRLACYESSLATSDTTQTFAFNNSPRIWGNAARWFYRKSKHMANRYAWLEAMDDRPGLGKNSPVVYTRAMNRPDALAIHRAARLADIELIPSANGTTWYAYTWVDHGLRGKCSPVPEECEGVDD
ncbi:hypothetical protein [Paraliomyxa miuraensis]|uniref:hypothetical protein n=1 Tax=Paraliomyxa miuraensis TaxID=376150 RepID=UPI0022569753|nr:hypothetical protein [Paraliomyxa miuraensis]MCX4244408.1 hypothetical protein [Paraliomyxa miuraensis]